MAEKTIQPSDEGDNEKNRKKESENPEIKLDLTIQNSYKGKLTFPKGTTLKEILEIIAKQQNINVSEFRVILNGEQIDLGKENPILRSHGTLSLIKNIEGG